MQMQTFYPSGHPGPQITGVIESERPSSPCPPGYRCVDIRPLDGGPTITTLIKRSG